MGSCQKRKQPDIMSSVHEVNVPFRERVALNTSRFTVLIPRIYNQMRLFHFTQLFISPNLFNIEAQELQLGANAEDKIANTYPVNLTAHFSNLKAFFPIHKIIKFKQQMPLLQVSIIILNPKNPILQCSACSFLIGLTSTISCMITTDMLN